MCYLLVNLILSRVKAISVLDLLKGRSTIEQYRNTVGIIEKLSAFKFLGAGSIEKCSPSSRHGNPKI